MVRIPTGRLYHPKFRDRRSGEMRESPTWWVQYYVPGNAKPIRESAETNDEKEAIAFLRKKMAGIATRIENTQPERVKIGELLDLVEADYKRKQRKSTGDLKSKIKVHLRPEFGGMKAIKLTTQRINGYVAMRKEDGAQNASINRELSVLRRAFNLGLRHDPPMVVHVPTFEMLPEDNIREGLVEHSTYCKLRDLLPSYARLALVISYHTGSRRGELLAIKTAGVDFKAGRILLGRKTTKSNRDRFLPIYGDMAAEIQRAIAANDPRCPFLVQRDGHAVVDFRKSWATACELAGLPTALFHDLRRTALTNMIAAGLSELEAMEISGHKTRAVFERYVIKTEKRLRQNAAKLEAHLAGKAEQAKEEGVKEAVN